MPRLIAHRGNIYGPSEYENSPSHILKALERGFDVEVDVWVIDGILYLGHNYAQYIIGETFLELISDRAWIHCKNLEALLYFSKYSKSAYSFFWHENDRFTLTSDNLIWTFPGQPVTENSITVELDRTKPMDNVYGICSDYVAEIAVVA